MLFIRSSERTFPTRRRLTPFESFNGSFYTTSQSGVTSVFWNNIVVVSYPFFVDMVVFVCVRWLHPFEQCAHKGSSTLRNIDYFCSGFYTIHSPSTACTRVCQIRQCRSITIRVWFCLGIFYFLFFVCAIITTQTSCTTLRMLQLLCYTTRLCILHLICAYVLYWLISVIFEIFFENEPLTAIRVMGSNK